MKENFDIAMRFVFYYEKWKSVDPQDPGGLTIWGVCHRDFPAEVDQMLKMTPEASQEFAKEIYRKRFWQEIGGDNIPSLLDIVIFDAAVNQGINGIGRAIDIRNDAANWWDALILRDDRYDDLLGFNRFGRGWLKRTCALRDYITSDFTVLEWDRKEFVPANKGG